MQLGDVLIVESNDLEDRRLVDMFHSHIEPESVQRIPNVFCKNNSNLRVLITSVALGMGIHIPDVQCVVHWGPSSDVLLYWQEVGRCARDGRQGRALLYTPPNSLNSKYVTSEMLDLVKNNNRTCIRKIILTNIRLEEMSIEQIDVMCGGDNCCSVCDAMDCS